MHILNHLLKLINRNQTFQNHPTYYFLTLGLSQLLIVSVIIFHDQQLTVDRVIYFASINYKLLKHN